MAPARTRLEEILLLRSELNRLLEDLSQPPLDQSGSWIPPMDCSEDTDTYHIRIELPGISLKDVELKAHGKTLLIEGIRQSEKGIRLDQFMRMERFYGRFRRTIKLPAEFDWNQVDARLENGVLTIAVPKSESAP